MDPNTRQSPGHSPATDSESSSADSISSLTMPLGAPSSLVTPQGQTVVITPGSSCGGTSDQLQKSTPSKGDGSRKSPDFSSSSEEDEVVEVLSGQKHQSFKKSLTDTTDARRKARNRAAKRRRSELASDLARNPFHPTFKMDWTVKKVGERKPHPWSSSMGGVAPGGSFGVSGEGLRYTWDLDVNDLGPKPAWWSDADSDDHPVKRGVSDNTDEPQPSTSRGSPRRNNPPVVMNVEKDNEAFRDCPLFKYNFMFSGIGTTQEEFADANTKIREIGAECWAQIQEDSQKKETTEEQRQKDTPSPKRLKSDDGHKPNLDEGSSDDE